MLFLYNYHSNPESLYKFENRFKFNKKLTQSFVETSKIRIPELEHLMLQSNNIHNMTQYCCIHNFRWPELEQILINPNTNVDDSDLSIYIDNLIPKRWPEAEHIIIQKPYSVFTYTTQVLNTRWLKAEPIIQSVPHLWNLYKTQFDIDN